MKKRKAPKKSGPAPTGPGLDKREQRHLRDLAGRLEQAGYQDRALCELFDIYELFELRNGISARTRERARQDSALAQLGSFWFLGQFHPRRLLEGLMGAHTLAVLKKLRLVAEAPQGLCACAHLFPCAGGYLFTDRIAFTGDPTFQVYWLGSDSLALARSAPRAPVARALDLCTGSGVHAVLAGKHSQESWGVDINPRALECSRVNALLNGVSPVCRFVEGSLYDPVPEGRFDLITANPPFVPTPRSDLALFRPGGETGEAITEAIVRGLVERLEVGGVMALVSQVPIMTGGHALDRVEQWLGGSAGWGLGYMTMSPVDKDDLIAGHLTTRGEFLARHGPVEGEAAYRKEFETWLDSYQRHGIEGADLAVTYVRRLPDGTPGWRSVWTTSFPQEPVSEWVQRWLEAQDRFALDPEWDWRPAWGRGLRRLMVDVRNGEGFVFQRPAFGSLESYLEPESAYLLGRADGRVSARELLEAYARRYDRSPDQAGPEVSRRLAELGRQLMLV